MVIRCKHSENGCEYVGVKEVMQSHEESCLFRNVECPKFTCDEKLQVRFAIDHLKNSHKCDENKGPLISHFENEISDQNGTYNPNIILFDGQKFLQHCIVKRNIWRIWVTVLGDGKLAQNYEAKFNIPEDGARGTPASLSFKGKVYSADIEKDYVQEDHEGILDFPSTLALKLGDDFDADGEFKIHYKCQIQHTS